MTGAVQGASSRALGERAVDAVIIANAGLLVAGLMVHGHEAVLEVAHEVCLGVFVLELVLRVRAHGSQWLRRPLNAFDAGIIFLSFMPMLGVDAGLLRLARLARVVHLMRHLTHLRMWRVVRRIDPVLVAGAVLAVGGALTGAVLLGI